MNMFNINYKLFEFISDTIYDEFYKFILNIDKVNTQQLMFLTDTEDFING